ncbi:cytochrome P450 [Bradyrhizobium sp. USDA 4341]
MIHETATQDTRRNDDGTASVAPSSAEWSMLSLVDKDPFPVFEILRERGPVVWDPGVKCWLVLSYDLCKEIESDDSTYRPVTVGEPPSWTEIRGGKPTLPSSIDEEHTRMRRLYLKLLSPAVMPRYRDEHVLPVINDAIDRIASQGSAELFHELIEPIPPRIMASLFGLPWRDDAFMADIAAWHKDMMAWIFARDNVELAHKAKLASDELNRVFLDPVLERRDKRGNDFISQIWSRAPEDLGGEIGVTEVMSIVRDIEIGAGDTSTSAIANAVYVFLSDPALREAVTKDQDRVLNAFVEETLRVVGSVQFRFRKANRGVSLAGTVVKEGDVICLLHSAANRDPKHYACPHKIDLNRKSPTDHLTFNTGPRICPGMHLARLKLRECMKLLMQRLPNLRLDPAKQAPSFSGFTRRTFAPLHVIF